MIQQSHSWACIWRKAIIWKDTCIPVFIAALFIIAKTWKQPECLLAQEWIHIYNGVLLSHKKDSVQFSSVAQSCLTLCNPMNCSTPGLPVHHQLPEFTQTHVHRVSDAIQPSHPLSSCPSSPAPNPSQRQSLFQWVNSSHEVGIILFAVTWMELEFIILSR